MSLTYVSEPLGNIIEALGIGDVIHQHNTFDHGKVTILCIISYSVLKLSRVTHGTPVVRGGDCVEPLLIRNKNLSTWEKDDFPCTWPAVSHIWSLIFFPLSSMVLILKSIPIVEMKVVLKASSENLKHDYKYLLSIKKNKVPGAIGTWRGYMFSRPPSHRWGAAEKKLLQADLTMHSLHTQKVREVVT